MTKRIRKPGSTIVVDGVAYIIPLMLHDATDEEIERWVRMWRHPDATVDISYAARTR